MSLKDQDQGQTCVFVILVGEESTVLVQFLFISFAKSSLVLVVEPTKEHQQCAIRLQCVEQKNPVSPGLQLSTTKLSIAPPRWTTISCLEQILILSGSLTQASSPSSSPS